MKIYKKKIPLYFETLKIVVSKDFEKSLKALKVPHQFDVNNYDSFIFPHKDCIYLFINSKATAGVIAHEAVHIVNYVFKRANISLDFDNDEPQAYLMGWIVDTIHKCLK